MVHLLRGERQILRDADSIGARLDRLGGSCGFHTFLWIPSVHVGLPAAHVEVDDVLGGGRLLQLRGPFKGREGFAGERVP